MCASGLTTPTSQLRTRRLRPSPGARGDPAGAPSRASVADERWFDAVLDAAGALVCVIDPDGRFVRFNRACELVSGYTFEEIRGRPIYDFLIPDHEVEDVRLALGRLRAGEPPEPNENHWVTRDGALRLISWLDACFFDERGLLTHVVSTGIDVTEERRAGEALRGIEAVGMLLAKHGPTRESMAAVLRTLADGMGYPYLAVCLWDGGTFRLGGQLGYDNLPEVLDPAAGIAGRCLRTGRAALIPDVSLDPDYVVGHAEVTSAIAVPLAADGAMLGVLTIESTLLTPLTEADLRLAQTVAERLSVALVLGREQQATADRAKLFAALIGFARVANSTLDADGLMPGLADAIGDVLEVDALVVVALDRSSGHYLVRAVRGGINAKAVGTEIPVGQGISGRAMASRALVFDRVDRSRYSPGLRQFIEAQEMSMAGIPLIHDGAVLGAIVIGRSSDREPAFSALECEALTLLAAQAALSLANSHLLEEVSELAIRDALTGLYNRRHFDASVDHILRRRARQRGARPPVAAVMFDLDHFGKFNRDHGHQAGDAVLRFFAGVLLERFRSSDLVARYGGEEFVAVLESATLEDAQGVAEEVRASLAGRSIIGPGGTQLRATVSVGCAALDDLEPTREALLRAADVGLFMAKRAGRNRVVSV